MDQDPGPDGPGVHRAAGAGEARGPAHRLPGGRLPEHLRVLGRPRGDVPHRRRPVHPALRLLPDRHRQAASRSTATSRAGSPRACRRWACATRPSPASPATTSPTAGAWLYAETVAPDPRTQPRHRRRAADPGLQRRRPSSWPRSSAPAPRCSPTTSRPCRGSSSRSGPAFRYERSLDVIRAARAAGLVTKSNLILGMGEDRDEISQALLDLHAAGCELITITQYLRPSARHHPVERWVQARGVRRAARRGRGDRLRRRHERAAGALVLPGRTPLPAGDRRARLTADQFELAASDAVDVS